MFTGIVEMKGVVEDLQRQPNLGRLSLRPVKRFVGVKKGDSVAVNGVCLTVVTKQNGVLSFDVMKETLDCTTLGALRPGDEVNLERALGVQTRLDGHFVTGHVDDVVRLKKIVEAENYTEFRFGMKKSVAAYLVPKGSVALDGISLTVGRVCSGWFSVYLIPLTKEITTFGSKKEGDVVNIETDILAKYVLEGRKTKMGETEK